MTPPLFLVADLPAADEFVLDGDEGRHGARSLRLRAGETVLVGDGRGGVLTCAVSSVDADELTLTAVTRRFEPPPHPRLVVVQALPKGERAELAVELLTELGVDEIVPWQASRSVVRWDGTRAAKAIERWRTTARAAAKQSRRSRLVTIGGIATTTEVERRCRGALLLHENATAALATVELPATDEVVLVVGPEGGISPDELDRFVAAGATAVRLGDPVLRTSTAGAAALAVLSARLGRWG